MSTATVDASFAPSFGKLVLASLYSVAKEAPLKDRLMLGGVALATGVGAGVLSIGAGLALGAGVDALTGNAIATTANDGWFGSKIFGTPVTYGDCVATGVGMIGVGVAGGVTLNAIWALAAQERAKVWAKIQEWVARGKEYVMKAWEAFKTFVRGLWDSGKEKFRAGYAEVKQAFGFSAKEAAVVMAAAEKENRAEGKTAAEADAPAPEPNISREQAREALEALGAFMPEADKAQLRACAESGVRAPACARPSKG